MRSKQGPAGFTFVELLVAISVVAILASLLLPGLAAAKAKAQAAQCKGNLRQIALAQAKTAAGIPNGTEFAYQRHARKFNTAFADAHFESLKVDRLFFSTEDQDRRRWFRDDEPHREWIE